MDFKIVNVQREDLDAIMSIEKASFSTAEAATRAAMQERIQKIPDTFLVAKNNSITLGYVVGPSFSKRYLTDDLYSHILANNPTDPYQTVLSLAVSPNVRHQGIATKLLRNLAQVAEQQNRQAITLTCLAALVPFYERQGYLNEGLSQSQHASEHWYNLVLTL